MPDKLKPGEKAPFSGQYVQIGPRGGKGIEITISKGEIMPPTPTAGGGYKIVDRSKNKSGRK